MDAEEQDYDPEVVQAELDYMNFQSRFTFSFDLPPPDEWRERTRTYPSQKNDRRNGIFVPERPPISRPLPPPPPPLLASSLTSNAATETDLPDGPVQPPAMKGMPDVQPASETSPEPASSLSSLSPPPSSESPPPTSRSTPSQSSNSTNSVSANSKQGSSSSDTNRPRAGSKSKLAPPKRRPPPPPPQQPIITVNGKPAPTTSQSPSSSTAGAAGDSGTVGSSQAAPQVNGVGAEPVVAGQTTAGVSKDQTSVGVESGLMTSNLKNDVGVSGTSNSGESNLRVETNEHSKGSGTVSPLLSRSWDNIEIPLRVED